MWIDLCVFRLCYSPGTFGRSRQILSCIIPQYHVALHRQPLHPWRPRKQQMQTHNLPQLEKRFRALKSCFEFKTSLGYMIIRVYFSNLFKQYDMLILVCLSPSVYIWLGWPPLYFMLSSTDSMAQKFWGLTPLFTVIVYQPEVQAKMFWLIRLPSTEVTVQTHCSMGDSIIWTSPSICREPFHKRTRCSNSNTESSRHNSQKCRPTSWDLGSW